MNIDLAGCTGTTFAAVVGERIRILSAGNVGMPTRVETRPFPPGGKPLALSAIGDAALTEDGKGWHWWDNRWNEIGSVHDEERER